MVHAVIWVVNGASAAGDEVVLAGWAGRKVIWVRYGLGYSPD